MHDADDTLDEQKPAEQETETKRQRRPARESQLDFVFHRARALESAAKRLALAIEDNVPEGPGRNHALTLVQQATVAAMSAASSGSAAPWPVAMMASQRPAE